MRLVLTIYHIETIWFMATFLLDVRNNFFVAKICTLQTIWLFHMGGFFSARFSHFLILLRSSGGYQIDECIGKWQKTCKFFVIYSQASALVRRSFYDQFRHLFFSKLFSRRFMNMCCVCYAWICTIKIDRFDICTISRKKRREHDWNR